MTYMMSTRSHMNSLLALLGDILSLGAAFSVAYAMRKFLFVSRDLPFQLEEHLRLLVVGVPIFLVSFYHFGLYRNFPALPLVEGLGRLIKALLCALLSLTLLIFWLKYQYTSRIFLVLFGVFCYLFIIGVRMGLRGLVRRIQPQRKNDVFNVLIVGDDERSKNIAEAIQEHRHLGLHLLGQVRNGGPLWEGHSVRVLGTLPDFARVVQDHVVDAVVFTGPYTRLSAAREALAYCMKTGIRVFLDANPFEESMGPMVMGEVAGVNLITFADTALSDEQLFMKRCFDLALSSALLIVFSPVIIVASALIKLFSAPGPVFFRQERIGMNGRRFTAYKFRTMVKDAENMKAQLLPMNEMDGPVFKIYNDPRVTRLGRFLRRTSIDELPQLFNVLIGHMSIVGPRPPLPEEVGRYELWQRRRLSVKPGLTCLWQVRGRNRLDFDTWMNMDMEYIDNWSWLMDFKILIRTVPAMFRGQ